MSAVVWRAMLLLTLQIVPHTSAQGCSSGWFGQYCTYKCNCNVSNTCGPGGECPSRYEQCKLGFFGPGCQYVDMAERSASVQTAKYLYDNSHATCNPDKNATSVEFGIRGGLAVGWLRIYSSNNSNFYSFVVRINGYPPSPDERKYIVNDHEVDVMWDEPYEIANLEIVGDIAPTICTIRITPGRHALLRQFANQTSMEEGKQGQASNGVDGSINDQINGGSCVITKTEPNPVWSLYFIRPHIVTSGYIYSSENRDTLLGFNIRTINAYGNAVVNFTDLNTLALASYHLVLKPFLPVMKIEVRPKQEHASQPNSLQFCELQLFGDHVCPPTTYGLECDRTCNCGTNQKCNRVTGACSVRCPPDKFGPSCGSRCGTYCYQERCHEDTGACFQCHEGYKGDQCNVLCSPGTFGSGCTYKCSATCFSDCDIMNGRCTECVRGYFGKQCSDRCPIGCLNRICHRDSGACDACISGRVGRFCNACPPGTYGPICYLECSPQCFNRTCDTTTGRCLRCTEGFTGIQCRNEPVTKTVMDDFLMLMIVLVITFIIIIPLILIFCLQRDSGVKPEHEGEGEGFGPRHFRRSTADDGTSYASTGV